MTEVLGLFNEYWISFPGQMKDRKYIFGPHTISTAFNEPLPIINQDGILVNIERYAVVRASSSQSHFKFLRCLSTIPNT